MQVARHGIPRRSSSRSIPVRAPALIQTSRGRAASSRGPSRAVWDPWCGSSSTSQGPSSTPRCSIRASPDCSASPHSRMRWPPASIRRTREPSLPASRPERDRTTRSARLQCSSRLPSATSRRVQSCGKRSSKRAGSAPHQARGGCRSRTQPSAPEWSRSSWLSTIVGRRTSSARRSGPSAPRATRERFREPPSKISVEPSGPRKTTPVPLPTSSAVSCHPVAGGFHGSNAMPHSSAATRAGPRARPSLRRCNASTVAAAASASNASGRGGSASGVNGKRSVASSTAVNTSNATPASHSNSGNGTNTQSHAEHRKSVNGNNAAAVESGSHGQNSPIHHQIKGKVATPAESAAATVARNARAWGCTNARQRSRSGPHGPGGAPRNRSAAPRCPRIKPSAAQYESWCPSPPKAAGSTAHSNRAAVAHRLKPSGRRLPGSSGARLASAMTSAARITGAPEPASGINASSPATRHTSGLPSHTPSARGKRRPRKAHRSENGNTSAAASNTTCKPLTASRCRVPVRAKRSVNSGASMLLSPKHNAAATAPASASRQRASRSSPRRRHARSGLSKRRTSPPCAGATRTTSSPRNSRSGLPRAAVGRGPRAGMRSSPPPSTRTCSPGARVPAGTR